MLLYLIFFAAIAWQVNALPQEHLLSRAKDPDWGLNCAVDGNYSVPDHCNTYIQCIHRTKSVKHCPSGLEFNYEIEKCVEPCEAYCNMTLSCLCKWSTCGVDDICFQERKIGPCRAGFSRYWFNRTSGQCQKFYWGGCQPNKNNFETKEQCEKKCGKRESYEPSFPASFKCRKEGLFPYPYDCNKFIQCSEGSVSIMKCPGDKHFNSVTQRCESSCDAKCDRTKACECGWDSCNNHGVCYLSPNHGPCNGKFDRYYFDRSSGKCKSFSYGGCRGNGNNFLTKEKCVHHCESHLDNSLSELITNFESKEECGSDCQQTKLDEEEKKTEDVINPVGCYWNGFIPDFDNCSQYFQCFDNGTKLTIPCKPGQHYNQALNRCTEPCDAFCDTSIACKCGWPTCKKADDFTCVKDGLYKNPEFCSAYIHCSNGRKHDMPCPTGQHFSEKTRKCESPCEAHCDGDLACPCNWTECKESSQNICRLSADKGPCKSHTPSYYFDHKREKCEKFTYGGCKGNGNNFATLEECEKRCSKNEELLQCGENAHFKQDYMSCQKNCSNWREDIPCRNGAKVYGCFCDTGYVRGPGGKCIPPTRCMHSAEESNEEPPCAEHEHFESVVNCTWDKYIPCSTGLKPGCVCDDGYVKGLDGKCIPTSEDTKFKEESEETCPINEQFSLCGAACQRDCTNYKKWVFICPIICRPGCVCKKGLVRNSLGKCIPTDECRFDKTPESESEKEPQCAEHEHFESAVNCPWDRSIPCSTGLKPGCVCDEGYVRGSDGKCIPTSEDTKFEEESEETCPINEQFSLCRAACQRDCTNYKDWVFICPIICRPGCVCKKGLVRNSLGKCIPTDECQFDKTLESESETFNCPLPSGHYAHPYDCSVFYECEGSVPKLRSCQGGQYFDRIIKVCVEERYDTRCSYQCEAPEGKFPHPRIDKMLISCTNNVPRVETCLQGEIFDAHRKECADPRE